jgi:cytochrome c-type biogenesis protein CcmE
LVTEGTIDTTGSGVSFVVTDGDQSIDVTHTGAPPQLFQENIGVVVEGTWAGNHFESDTLIINHDEEYVYEDNEGAYIPPADS